MSHSLAEAWWRGRKSIWKVDEPTGPELQAACRKDIADLVRPAQEAVDRVLSALRGLVVQLREQHEAARSKYTNEGNYDAVDHRESMVEALDDVLALIDEIQQEEQKRRSG